jgi:hypothetical protein
MISKEEEQIFGYVLLEIVIWAELFSFIIQNIFRRISQT